MKRTSTLYVVTGVVTLSLAACVSGRHEEARRVSPSKVATRVSATRAAGTVPEPRPVVRHVPETQPAHTDGPSGANIRINQDSSGFDQNETTIAVDPSNPDRLLAAANDARLGRWAVGYYRSADGGATWSDGIAPFQRYSTQADPGIAFCPNGTAILTYIDYSGEAFTPSRLVAAHSPDGGANWFGPAVLSDNPSGTGFADRPLVGCGRNGSGAFSNRIYASWTIFASRYSQGLIQFSSSDDGGVSWTPAILLSSSGAQSSMPVPGLAGETYVVWHRGSNLEIRRTIDGGGSWANPRVVSNVVAAGDTNFRRPTYPAGAIDTSGGPFHGTIYVAWHDRRFGDPDILISRSADGGTTWSAPQRVNDDLQGNGRDQFMPWLSVDDRGTVIVKFFDRRHDPANLRQHVFTATSHDGGQSFENLRVTDVDSDPSTTSFLGDYSAIASLGGYSYTMWSDLRSGTGEEDVYVDRLRTHAYDTVTNVRFIDSETLQFDDQAPRTGIGIVYDVVSGSVSELPSSERASLASCAAEDRAATTVSVPGLPVSGEAHYYLVRAQGPRGIGGFGYATLRPNPRERYDHGVPCAQ